MRTEILVQATRLCADIARPPEPIKSIMHLGRTMLPEQIVQTYRADSLSRFATLDSGATPVLIADHQEEKDIVTTLLALSQSEIALTPIVVENGSTDRTAEFAAAMGATVWTSPYFGKSRALKYAFQLIAKQYGFDNLLLTDADTLTPPTWAKHMVEKLQRPVMENGGVVCGSAIRYDDRQPFLNAAKTLRHIYNVKRMAKAGEARPGGYNMGIIGSGTYDPLEDLAVNFNDEYVLGDDTQIAAIVGGGERVVAQSLDRKVRVFTRGNDRNTWAAWFKARLQQDPNRAYSDWITNASKHNAGTRVYENYPPAILLQEEKTAS